MPGVFVLNWLNGDPDGKAFAFRQVPISLKGKVTAESLESIVSENIDRILADLVKEDRAKFYKPSTTCAYCEKPALMRSQNTSVIEGDATTGAPTFIICVLGLACGGPGSKCFTRMKVLTRDVLGYATNKVHEAQPGVAQSTHTSCLSCGLTSSNAKADMKRCSVCKKAYYCSVACQRVDFPKHKLYCTPATELKVEEKAMKGLVKESSGQKR